MFMTSQELIHDLPGGLLAWFTFRENENVLYVTADTDFDRALADTLSENISVLKQCRAWEMGPSGQYDCVILADALSQAGEQGAAALLTAVYHVLKTDGRLFVCAENRLGIRYFCGDQDPFTGRSFDSIENYRRISPHEELKGKLYAKAELVRMLEEAGFSYHRFYSVFPDLSCPQILFSETCLPEEELKIRIFPRYHNPATVFLEEENLYTPLLENGLFHTMANGFLIECPRLGDFSGAVQVTVSMERGRENALCTIIREDGKVEKKPAFAEGKDKVWKLMDNHTFLQKHGIRMIEGHEEHGSYVMPYIKGIPLAKYFRALAATDQEVFYRQFDRLWDLILSSSEHVPYEVVDWERINPWWDEMGTARTDRGRWKQIAFGSQAETEAMGPVLERGYVDLVLINGFRVGEDFVFYDQELYVKHLPAKAIMLRNIDFLYHGDAQMEKLLPRQKLLERYNMLPCMELYYCHIGHFLTKLRNDDILKPYLEAGRRNDQVVHANRQRMNWPTAEYQKLFVDIFEHLDNRKIYLFGAGSYARKFLALYGDAYEVDKILDNDPEKWGRDLDGIQIFPPSVVQKADCGTYKVIICMKNYTGALKQIRELGVTCVSIYDTGMEYSRRKKNSVTLDTGTNQEKKKYHTGYVAGVFDLFHIGHLNLLRRAKEQCEYLIVGVVTDEGVRKHKNTEPFIPFAERLGIVSACRYVDEAVEIPFEYCDTQDAYARFGFDVQFSGSDYADDPLWLKKQEFLRERGSELVFFPYTESTCSSRLKDMINRKLI